MLKTKKCLICGAEFQTNKPNKRYCSFICKEAGRQIQRLKWIENHPHYNTEYSRKYRKKKKCDPDPDGLSKNGCSFKAKVPNNDMI